MFPLDAKSLFETLDEMKDLGEANSKAFTYYEGMISYCVETNETYRWEEVTFGSNGLITPSFVYPPNTIVKGKDYSERIFNFVLDSSQSSGIVKSLFYTEPSVNIEIKEETNPTQAMYFGTLNIGTGVQNVALVSNNFVSQSGFQMLANENVGAEIKMVNGTNNTYLGHFTITENTYGNYRILDIIEKSDWDLLTDYNIQKVFVHVVKPSPYNVEILGTNLVFTKGNQLIYNTDLDNIFGGNVATIADITLDEETGIVTFLFTDNSTITEDFSGILNADGQLSKESFKPVQSSDIYENLFVSKSINGFMEKGFYTADLTTNYNSTSFPGFPYPAGIDFVMCKYESRIYLLVKKDISVGKRIFNKPNDVLGLSFFKYKDNTTKSMQKLAYIKILSRKIALQNLNSNYWAFRLWSNAGTNFPLATPTIAFNEYYYYEGVNEKEAYCMVTKIYEEVLSLKKTVTLPYTIKEEDNGLILHIESNGNNNLIVPLLPIGFECGLVQSASDVNEITIIASSSGVTIRKPADKSTKLLGQYYSAYLMCNNEFTNSTSVVNASLTNEYLLSGDLKDL
tara:strand:- start:50807 stop:52510 length:1704 start_codon:yes stop_codon:yes gene_type:complete